MTKIMVTGVTGYIGRKTLEFLMERIPTSSLIGLARDPAKAADLTALGVEIRQGDYADRPSLDKALRGIDKLMLVSTHAFTDRNTAHANVIDAAVENGLKHVVIMPVYHMPGSSFTMKEITEEDRYTEEKLLSSGLGWTIVRHPPFLENLSFYIGGKAQENGIRIPVGPGRVAAASRDDLAAAHAAILAETGHEGKSYILTGDPAVSFREIAGLIAKGSGRSVPFAPVSAEQYVELLQKNVGVPQFVAEFGLKWVEGVNNGEWEEVTSDLEFLIGRKPKSAQEFYTKDYLTDPQQ